MTYRDKKTKNIIGVVALVVFVLASLIHYIATGAYRDVPANLQVDSQSFSAHYIDVGQGDSTLIIYGGEAMLIDAGTNESGKNVVAYIKSQGVETLKYVIGTHPHEDHIGGMDDVINAFAVEHVLMPDVETTTKTFEDVLDAVESKNLEIEVPAPGDILALGAAGMTILSPVPGESYSDLNDYSISLRMEAEGQSFLFTGDSGKTANQEMLQSGRTLSAAVYKVSHHGSDQNNLEPFLEAVHPRYAIISCGANNSYGHPHAAVLDRLNAMGTIVYRTDKDGTIILKVDNGEIQITTQK